MTPGPKMCSASQSAHRECSGGELIVHPRIPRHFRTSRTVSLEEVSCGDRSLNAAVTKLRQALGDSADNPRFIETQARRGYRFIAPVNVAVEPIPMITTAEAP